MKRLNWIATILFCIFITFANSMPASAQGYHTLHTYPQRYGGMTAQEVQNKGLETIVLPHDVLCSIQSRDMSWTPRKYLHAGEPVAGRWLNAETFQILYVIRCGNRVEEGITLRFPKAPVVELPPAETPAQAQQIIVNVYNTTAQQAAAQGCMPTGGQYSTTGGGGMFLSIQPRQGDINVGGNTFNVAGGNAYSNSTANSQSQAQTTTAINNVLVNGNNSAGAGSANSAGSQTQCQP